MTGQCIGIPGMTSILDHQPPKMWSFLVKTEVKWISGNTIMIYNGHVAAVNPLDRDECACDRPKD